MRDAWVGLHARGGVPQELYCGRKFCPMCGRWRHLVDFRPRADSGRPSAYCEACRRTYARGLWRRKTPEQLERHREANRFSMERYRRAQGIRPRDFKHRKSVVDQIERVFLDARPLRAELLFHVGEWEAIAERAGLAPRQVYRVVYEQPRIFVQTADRLAYAMNIPLALLYPRAD